MLKNGIAKLNEYDVEEADWKAKLLLLYELEISKEQLAMQQDNEMNSQKIKKFDKHMEELIQGKPLQYITNSQGFYGLDFYVDENVLIPQPDTEILVEEIVNISKNKKKILDICTGSGAIAIAIAKNTDSEIQASDISWEALEIAKKNAINHDVKIEWIQSDLFENIEGKFDVIVSNPPYIETKTISTLSPEVKNEPFLALDGGEDGLEFYRVLTQEAKRYLVSGGILAVEIGYNQKEKVMQLFEKAGFCEIYAKKDWGKQDRIVVGKWR